MMILCSRRGSVNPPPFPLGALSQLATIADGPRNHSVWIEKPLNLRAVEICVDMQGTTALPHHKPQLKPTASFRLRYDFCLTCPFSAIDTAIDTTFLNTTTTRSVASSPHLNRSIPVSLSATPAGHSGRGTARFLAGAYTLW